MIKNYYKISLFVLLLLLSQPSFSLSLGEIKVTSTFAQPFSAEIALPSYTKNELKSIRINLASRALFAEQDTEFLPILRKFKFSVEEKKGRRYIKVSTKKPIKELHISFLLEVSWHGGNIIKNYDVLLTPEAITQFREKTPQTSSEKKTDNTAKAQSSIISKNVEQKKTKKPKPSSPATQLTSSNTAKKALPKNSNNRVKMTKDGGIVYADVTSGESLRLVAKRIRSGRNMSSNQVMIALFHENPGAFINNDINNLKTGVTLKIKDIENVTHISKQRATELAKQYLNKRAFKASPIKIANKSQAIGAEDLALGNPKIKNELPQNMLKTKDETQVNNNRLIISSAKEAPIPQEIMQKIKQERLTADKEELNARNLKIEELQTENNALKERILALEEKRETSVEHLFLATIEQEIVENGPESDSLTQQGQNLAVTNTDLEMEGNEKLSLMQRIEKHQMAISISSIALLSMTVIGIRKKEEILDVVHNFMARFNRGT